MRGAEGVVIALRPLGEAGQAAALAQGADAVAAPGENFVRIALMADVPDQAVGRRVEDIVQRHRQFDDAEAGAEMPAGLGDRIDKVRAQLIRDLPQPVRLELTQIFRRADLIEKRRLGWFVQKASSVPRKGCALDIDGPVYRIADSRPHGARLKP